jgi:HAD superfamily hydrolase (TIGR01544 family)
MSYKHINELIETHSKPTIFHKKRHEHNQPQNIVYTDKLSFDQKLSNFIESYYQNKKSVAIVTDFDYTLTSRIDYKTGKLYSSSYYLYDEDIIGGDQRSFDERRQALVDKYSHYEFSTSYDIDTRKIKMKEWYSQSLSLYFGEKFTKDSIDEMVRRTKSNLLLRRKAIEYLELLMKLDITVVIESGGIGQFIEGYLKVYLPNYERYKNEKKIIIVSNMFKFDDNNGCVGLEHEVINCFNKADFLGNVVNQELPDLKYVMVLGDNLGDADSIKKINVPEENVIGFGFLNLPKDVINDENKRDYLKKKINESKNVFDVTFVGDCDYEPIIEILKNIRV